MPDFANCLVDGLTNHARCIAVCVQAVQAQRRKRQHLGGSVVQIGAEPPEVMLIDLRRAARCRLDPGAQGVVLLGKFR